MNNAEFIKSLINELSYRGLIKNKSDLADKLGISKSYISDLLSGRLTLTIDKMNKITELFNVKLIVFNGTTDFVFTENSEKLDPLFQESINYLKHFAHENPEKTTKFVKSLTDFLKE